MTREVLVLLDQGSSATKVSIRIGRRECARARVPLPRPFAPRDIIESVRAAAHEAVRAAGVLGKPYRLALANQRTTIVYLDAEGRPAGRVVPWWEASGVRLAPGAAEYFRRRTGLPAKPNWFAAKLARHRPRRAAAAATVDAFLVHVLSEGRAFVTDTSNAARTGLFDIVRGRRSKELRALFGVPEDLALPRVVPSAPRPVRLAPLAGLGPGRLVAFCGDAGASFFGGFRRGALGVITLGTGDFLTVPLSSRGASGRALPARFRRALDLVGVRGRLSFYLAPLWETAAGAFWALEAYIEKPRGRFSRSRRAEAIAEAVAVFSAAAGRRGFLVAGGGGAARDLLRAIEGRCGVSVRPNDDRETTTAGLVRLAAEAARRGPAGRTRRGGGLSYRPPSGVPS